MARQGVALLVLLLLGVPLANVGAQGGPDAQREASTVTFYGHVFDHGLDRPMPANTAPPIGEANYGIGGAAECTSATPADPAINAGDCRETEGNVLALFSTAGFVDVKDSTEFFQGGEYAQLHNERGQTKDVLLDATRPITATVYMTMDMHGWFVRNQYGTNCLAPHPPDVPCLYPYWGWDPGVFRDVVVEATLYVANLGEHGSAASEAPPIADVLAGGQAQVVAQGRWGPEVVMNGVPGAPNVNAFEVDLGPPQLDTVPRENDFFLVYRVYQETGGVNYLINAPFRWWSGELFPPSFTLPVKNAFDVERVIPNFAHGRLAILGVMNTPWGSYDIDPNSVELSIEGPNGAVVPEHISRFGDFSVAHGGHYLPINLTWIWDYSRDGLRAGTYTVAITASNFQHSAVATCEASFELRTGRGGDLVPGTVEEGVCGAQTASEAFVDELKRGATG